LTSGQETLISIFPYLYCMFKLDSLDLFKKINEIVEYTIESDKNEIINLAHYSLICVYYVYIVLLVDLYVDVKHCY
jgi:hypothetical protein